MYIAESICLCDLISNISYDQIIRLSIAYF